MENEGWIFFVLNKHNKHEQNIKYKLMRCNKFKKRAGNTEQKRRNNCTGNGVHINFLRTRFLELLSLI